MEVLNINAGSRIRILGGATNLSKVTWAMGFALLTALGAWIEVPTQPVPFTLQTFFVVLAGALLGKREGALSMVMYLALGSLGLPVFASGRWGIAALIGQTGGYLLAFPFAAWLVGWMIERRASFGWAVLSFTLGMLVIFALGTIQLNLVLLKDWAKAIEAGFLVFSWWDVLKIVAAASVYTQFRNRLRT